MLRINKGTFSGTTAELQARVAAFKAAVVAHAATVGVPAPREEEIVERLARTEEAFEVVEPPPPPEPPEPPTLEELRAKKAQEIRHERDRRTLAGGYQAGGKWFHSDTFSRTQQLGLVMLGQNMPQGIQWKTMDGSFIEMTPQLAQAVFAAAAASDIAIFAAAEAHRAAMEAAQDPAAYDFSGGWPAMYGEA